MNKPREWWLQTIGDGITEDAVVCGGSMKVQSGIHVIEYSAYQEKCEELEHLKGQYSAFQTAIGALREIAHGRIYPGSIAKAALEKLEG